MAMSPAMQWALANGMSQADVYKNINDFLATNPTVAQTQAQMSQYGISPEDVAAATGGKSGGLLGGNILAGASWNSLNTTLGNQLTAVTGKPSTNIAVGGATTADTLSQLNKFLAGGGQFDSNSTVYLQTGGVDFITGIDKNVVKNNISQIVKTLGSLGVNVVLTGSPYAKSLDDVINNNFDPKVDQIFTDIANENKNVALVGIQGEILKNKSLLVDALHTNAEGTAIYNQAVIDSLSQFKNNVPSSTPQAIAQVQQTNTVATTPSIITQAAASPVVAQSLATQTVDSLIKAGNLNPTQISSATGIPVGEILTKVASSVPQGQTITLGDTIIQPEYRVTGSGETQEIGNLETIYTSKTTGDVNYRAPVGSEYQQYGADGTFQRTGTTQKTANSFLGGLAEAFNDPVVQAVVLGLGGGGALGNALGLTGSTAQAVGTGLLKGGAAVAGGSDIEDALKVGLLSGGLVYGGNTLNNYLTTGSTADVGLTERQFAIQDAKQLANQGLTTSQIRDTLSSGGYNDAIVDRAITAITTTPAVVTTPVTDTSAVNVTAPSNVSLNNVLNTIASTTPAVTTPVTDSGTVNVTGSNTSLNNVLNTIASTTPAVTVTAPKTTQTVDQATLDLIARQLASNVTTPANLNNLANVTVTGEKPITTPVTTQDVITAISATLPALTTGTTLPTSTVPTTTITAPKAVTTQDVVNSITATIPAVVTSTIPTTTITAQKPSSITDDVTAATIPLIQPTTPLTVPEVTAKQDLTTAEQLRLAQLALTAAGLLGAGSALTNTDTGTQFPIVPIPADWKTPPATGVAPFTPLPPIDFGTRELLRGTQWEKFLNPNYGKVPEPVKYSQPSNISYSDLMGILGSKQGMPAKSSLSINDIISGIQNQYGQASSRTMG